MKKCPECESEKIIEGAGVIIANGNYPNNGFMVAVDANPDAFIFKERRESGVKTSICGDCGYMRFYAEKAQYLWRAYENRQKDVS